MRNSPQSPLLLGWCLLFGAMFAAATSGQETYIIHMDRSAMPAPYSTPHSWYMAILSSLTTMESSSSTEAQPTHLYTYSHVLEGFSAVLSAKQLSQLEQVPGHLATYPETYGHADTTRSPKFLGLNTKAGLWPAAGFGEDVIIGIIDSGIWPESESFNDDDMPPVPERWRGGCETGTAFNSSHCNRKLIGGKSFSQGLKQGGQNVSKSDDYDSPRDFFGHGTHTSSTAAGNQVPSVDYFGYAKGPATGIAPKARIAMYKVLFYNNSYDAAATDVLAGMDQAITDGVDVMSLSLGFDETSFDQNPIAIGAFSAMQKGIFVACSAGNNGPNAYTIHNSAPWITTVAAGSIDRQFAAEITLGDDELTLTGKSVFPESLFVSKEPLYYGQGNRSKEICSLNSLDPNDVAGKFIFCDATDQISVFESYDEMYVAGAAGGIFCSDEPTDFRPHDFDMPIVVVSTQNGELIKNYILKSSNATVDMRFKITNLGTKLAPQVADFSSRGPSIKSPWILKPDVMAPGVDILAAWVPNRASVPLGNDYLVTDYALVSGTSMACPHISGVAALIKSVHRDWSPAAIRSAMMTTASIKDNTKGPITDMITGEAATPLDYGGGHVSPNNAMDPGLVYDIDAQQYVDYMCGLNYTSQQIMTITGGVNLTCQDATLDLNYPSFILLLNQTNTTSYTFKRVLTNVADNGAIYMAVVSSPVGMKVVVQPRQLSFAGKLSTAEFSMTVEINLSSESSTRDDDPMSYYIGNFGYLTWVEIEGTHLVRSPIVSAYLPLPH